MALSPGRIFRGNETDFPHEREAIDYVLDQLPDSDPHQAWPLHELLDPGTGRLYEIDLLVLARSGLFLIEIKSHPGVLTGDHQDWTFSEPGGPQRHLACPYPGTNHKAKVLASLLSYNMSAARPYVQPLVFVSNPAAEIRLEGGCPPYVVTRDTIRQVLVHGLEHSRGPVVNLPVMRALGDTLRKLGLQPSKASRVVGGFRLKQLVDEREGYQEHHAVGATVESDTARVRSYLVPRATSVDRRHQLERAAHREVQILSRLGHHPGILSYRSYHPDGPLGPAVIFEAFKGGLPLNVFLKKEPDLSFDDRLAILQAVAEAVGHCHRAELLHRNLSPASVLVRRQDGKLEVRLHRFQTAAQTDHTSLGTRHLHQLAETLDRLYQAPEVIRDPRKAVPQSDLFSLGCLAWLLFTGRNPAATLAERETLIQKNNGLRIAPVRPDLANLDESLAWATEPNEGGRPDDALEWFEGYILEQLTRPPQAKEERRDPYVAEKGDTLDHNLLVVQALGSGATAKVLKVRRDERDFALKVPHDEGCEQRLIEEGRVLARLRHPHIIALHETPEVGGRRCLLLDYAGVGEGDKRHSSFADLLRAEGTLSLEKARRYGDDLLSAVQYIEEQGVTHRDIKPGNLGFTTLTKKARHLTLYDFSLAAGDPSAVRSGTPEWRDPWLHIRGQWDCHADRYASACVLYRMLAGTRPELAPDGLDAGKVRIEAERFDPAIRDRLKTFFGRCFQEDVGKRHPSTEEMRTDWDGLFGQSPGDETTTGVQPDTDILQTATLKTLVEVLPLSARARNALDRAGVVTVEHLLLLPRNHLSAIRGVGHKVAREIVGVASALGERLSAHTAAALLPSYAGPNIGLDAEELGFPSELVKKLLDAGITSTRDLARMPGEWAHRLLGEAYAARAATTLETLATTYAPAGTLDQWTHELLAPQQTRKTAAERRIRVLVGLDPLPGDAADEAGSGARTVVQVAGAFDVDASLIHGSMQTMRQRWQAAPCLSELQAAVREVLDALGPVCTMEEAAAELARLRGSGDDEDVSTVARALVRLVTETRPQAAHWRRVGSTTWVAVDPRALDALVDLGQEADAIACLEPLASSETVLDRLIATAAGTPLSLVAADRLVKLAARASREASTSARMELYPRGMSAARALKLSLNVLTPPGLTAALVRQRVRDRYPDAEPLPDRPALDPLLASHELRFDLQSQEYLRPDGANMSTTGTVMIPRRPTSASTRHRRIRTPEDMETQAFQDALDRGVESGRFRVVQVRADFAEPAATLLGKALGVTPLSLDHRIWETMHEIARGQVPDLSVIVTTDRAGPESPEWEHLDALVTRAAEQVIQEILSDRAKPTLLINPGILARFGLREPLGTLAKSAEYEDGAAILLVVPSHADDLAPSINNLLPVPTESGGQRMRLPESWLGNFHRAGFTQGDI